MPMITITKRDILRSKIVTPAWYRVHVEEVGEKTAKSGTSQNYPVEGTILFNADNGSKEFEGVPTPGNWMFNEKAIGLAVDFLKACGAEVDLEGGRFELSDAVGKDIDVFIGNGVYEGKTQNTITHQYRLPRAK